MRYVVTKQEVKFEEREVTEGVTLYKRARSRLWQARIRRVSGTWISISTRTEYLEVAKAVALRRHQEMKDAQARGEIDVVRKFSDVANLTMKELESELASGVGRTASTLFGSATSDCLIHRRHRRTRLAARRNGCSLECRCVPPASTLLCGLHKCPLKNKWTLSSR